MSPESITNLTTYSAESVLEIRCPLRGRDTFSHADWPSTAAGGTPEGHGGFAVLSFERQKHAARKSVPTPENRLIIRDAAQWK